MSNSQEPVTLTWLSGPDIDRLAMTDDEIIGAVEQGLVAQGTPGGAVIEPRMHLTPDAAFNGHFNVLRGLVGESGSGKSLVAKAIVGVCKA